MEFKRVLAPRGMVVKVVPGPNYLKELRDILYTSSNKNAYTNDETKSLFKEHFHLIEEFNLSEVKELNQTELMDLIQMSPLSWHAEKERIDSFMNQDSAGITIDLDILYGIHKHARN
jgi:23S rRNA (guanine745-N1)-methyltransferase